MNIQKNFAGITLKSMPFFGISDCTNDIPSNLLIINCGKRSNFPHNINLIHGSSDFTSDMCLWISLKMCIQNRIRNLVTKLVRMPFRNTF